MPLCDCARVCPFCAPKAMNSRMAVCLGGLASFKPKKEKIVGGVGLLINGINARVLIHSLSLCLRNTQLFAACTQTLVGETKTRAERTGLRQKFLSSGKGEDRETESAEYVQVSKNK